MIYFGAYIFISSGYFWKIWNSPNSPFKSLLHNLWYRIHVCTDVITKVIYFWWHLAEDLLLVIGTHWSPWWQSSSLSWTNSYESLSWISLMNPSYESLLWISLMMNLLLWVFRSWQCQPFWELQDPPSPWLWSIILWESKKIVPFWKKTGNQCT